MSKKEAGYSKTVYLGPKYNWAWCAHSIFGFTYGS